MRIGPDCKQNQMFPIQDTLDDPFHIPLTHPPLSLSLSVLGSHAAVSSTRSLLLYDLHNSSDPPRDLCPNTHTPTVCFHPSTAHNSLLLSAQDRSVLLHDISADGCRFRARVHDRSVADLSWSPADPNRFASCSSDSSVHVWDVRAPARKQAQFRSWGSGSLRVRFSRVRAHVLASLHVGGDVRVWDLRRGPGYSALLSAGTSAVDLDWSPWEENVLVTSGSAVKVWDVGREEYSKVGQGRQARFCEFAGRGAVSCVGDGGVVRVFDQNDGSILYSVSVCGEMADSSDSAAVAVSLVDYAFTGSEPGIQLVYTTTDQCLGRLCLDTSPMHWERQQQQQEQQEQEQHNFAIEHLEESKHTFADEVQLLSARVPLKNVHVELGSFIATISLSSLEFDLLVQVSARYPVDPPQFEILSESTLTFDEKRALLTSLKSLSYTLACRAQPSLEACFDWVLGETYHFTEVDDEDYRDSHIPDDARIMCPPMAGAVFGHQDTLVCFNNLLHIEPPDRLHSYRDLKAFAGRFQAVDGLLLGSGAGAGGGRDILLADSVDFGDSGGSGDSQDSGEFEDNSFMPDFEDSVFATSLTLVDVSRFLVCSRQLATEYSWEWQDPAQVCARHAQLCRSIGREDTAHSWELARIVCDNMRTLAFSPQVVVWELNPLGKGLAHALLAKHAQLGDSQTIAHLCVLWSKCLRDSHSTMPHKWIHGQDQVLEQYADYLYSMGLLRGRLQVLQCLDKECPTDSSLEFCTNAPLYCSVCRALVRGHGTACMLCGHGGHLDHISQWFASSTGSSTISSCPAGCGCICR